MAERNVEIMLASSKFGFVRRREFLAGTMAAASRGAWGQETQEAKLKRIGVMSLCFGSILKDPARADDANRTVDILDLPDIVAERFSLHYLEMQHSHFASTEPAYLAEFRSRLKKAKSQMNQINVEFGQLNISAAERVRRLETIDLTKAWIDHAAALGCPRVMVNQGSLAAEVRPTAIETLKTIAAYAKTKNVFITMENREMPRDTPAPALPSGQTRPPNSAPWDVLVEVCKATGTYANPDLQYFADDAARKAGLRVMYQMTSGSSHVKYNPERFNTAECLKISKEVGYKGIYLVEGGRNLGPDPYVSVKTILDVILANI